LEIRRGLEAFCASLWGSPPLGRAFAPLLAALELPDTAEALRHFLAALLGLQADIRPALTAYVLGAGTAAGDSAISAAQRDAMRLFASLYPNDPAIIAPLYLNLFSLEPGEAVFLGAGTLHAYIRGFGVELMANSDNVLRGGLSPKHIDTGELLRILDFSPFAPEIMRPLPGAFFRYPASLDEFSLARLCGAGGEESLPLPGASICLVTQGRAYAKNGAADGDTAGGDGIAHNESGGETELNEGEAVFIPARKPGEGPIRFRGTYTLYIASLPGPQAGRTEDDEKGRRAEKGSGEKA
jgi:mannose-6-phosphate isomerase